MVIGQGGKGGRGAGMICFQKSKFTRFQQTNNGEHVTAASQK